MKQLSVILFATLWLLLSVESRADSSIGDLRAVARDGQVFLTWHEPARQESATRFVYVSEKLITEVGDAQLAAYGIERHSARDWWQDPASFKKDENPGEPVGFLIENGGQRLDPQNGLFVYTVPKGSRGALYFAVTPTMDGKEDTTVTLGANSLDAPVQDAIPAEIEPIWQRPDEAPAVGVGRNKPLSLSLHGKSGVVAGMEYLAFGDESMGWRAGLPFKFSVRIEGDEVVIRPTDRTWINRPHSDGGGASAIWSFWYGYNSRIDDLAATAHGTPTNYTERRLLWILRWVQRHYQTDPARQYCSGSSMGGCGTISFGLRHPELFAALHAHVPIVSYTYLGAASARRLEATCWIGTITSDVLTDEGSSLLERMNGTRLVAASRGNLPPLSVIHGRRDGSIPWENNPSFYAAMNDARQSLSVYWDDGTHPTAGAQAPPDVKDWPKRMRRYRLDESYPTFTSTSSNRNPGHGRPDDGDIVGWINRGLDWSDIVDKADGYAITLRADYPGLVYPVLSDVTLRRVQRFLTKPNECLRVQVGDEPIRIVEADATGRITIPQVAISSRDGVHLTIERE